MLIPDIIVDLKFYKTEETGRKTPTSSTFFGCIFSINNDKHDCRLLLHEVGQIWPGESKADVPIKFLCPELVLPKLQKGSRFYLWEGKNIAEGKIKEIKAR